MSPPARGVPEPRVSAAAKLHVQDLGLRKRLKTETPNTDVFRERAGDVSVCPSGLQERKGDNYDWGGVHENYNFGGGMQETERKLI